MRYKIYSILSVRFQETVGFFQLELGVTFMYAILFFIISMFHFQEVSSRHGTWVWRPWREGRSVASLVAVITPTENRGLHQRYRPMLHSSLKWSYLTGKVSEHITCWYYYASQILQKYIVHVQCTSIFLWSCLNFVFDEYLIVQLLWNEMSHFLKSNFSSVPLIFFANWTILA